LRTRAKLRKVGLDEAEDANIGRLVFGAAALAFGLLTLAWHEYNDRNLLHDVWNGHGSLAFAYVVAAAQIIGGVAIAFRRSVKVGALVLAAMYLMFAFLWVPRIVAAPQTYDSWGSFFEQFSLAVGAALVYASISFAWRTEAVERIGTILLGVCTISFTVEQAIHLDVTAGLVPKWVPPNQMFWAIATTVGFALAAIALLFHRSALLATRLMTGMIASFGLIVWVPILVSNPHDRGNWGETVETFAIAGAMWILADLLKTRLDRGGKPRSNRGFRLGEAS
jgi:hypothetical protein